MIIENFNEDRVRNELANGNQFLTAVIIDLYENGPFKDMWLEYNISDVDDQRLVLAGVRELETNPDRYSLD